MDVRAVRFKVSKFNPLQWTDDAAWLLELNEQDHSIFNEQVIRGTTSSRADEFAVLPAVVTGQGTAPFFYVLLSH